MKRPRIQPVVHWLTGVITQPRSELDRWERAARFTHDLIISGAKQLRRDRAPQMAGALAFRTLFGLLPVLVMAAVVVRALRGSDHFVELVGTIIRAAGLKSVSSAEGNLGAMLEGLVGQAATYNTAAIGWIGLAVLAYAAVSLMVTIENSFNLIYRAPQGRWWTKRLPMYWFVLTLGPVAIGLSIYVNGRVSDVIEPLRSMKWVWLTAVFLWTFAVTWLLLFAVYTLVPNTSIRLRPAAIGALVAGILITLGKRVLAVYLANAVSITQFGGSLGLVPLFMLWVYVMWLVVLFGLEVAATLQMLAGRSLVEMEQSGRSTGLVDPTSILAVMEVVAARFLESSGTTRAEIVEATGLREETVQVMLDRLGEVGILHRLERGEDAVSLARPPDMIRAAELLDVAYGLLDGAHRRPVAIVERLREAQRTLAQGRSLVELLPAQPVGVGPDQAAGDA